MLITSQQCALKAKTANNILGCIWKSATSRMMLLSTGEMQLACWASQYRSDMDMLCNRKIRLPESLWNLHPRRYSKQPWATYSSWPCFDQNIGQRPWPDVPSNISHCDSVNTLKEIKILFVFIRFFRIHHNNSANKFEKGFSTAMYPVIFTHMQSLKKCSQNRFPPP